MFQIYLIIKIRFEKKQIGCFLWRKQEIRNQTEKKNEKMKEKKAKKKAKKIKKSKKKQKNQC